MNTKNVDMMARAFSAAAKNGAAKKTEKSEFRDIMNSSAASAKANPENIKQDRPENSQKPSGDKQSSKPQETGSSEQPSAEIPVKGPDAETADMAAAASLMAAMNIQAKPEIQTVSVEDGKISIAVMGNEIAKPETPESQMIQGVAAQAEKLQADSAEGMMQKKMPASEESQAGNTASQIQKTAAEASQPAEQKQQAQDIRLNQDMKHSAEADAKPEIQFKEKKSESDSEASDSNLNNDLSAMNRAQKSEQPDIIKVKVGDMQKAGSAEFTKAVAENIEIMKNGADSYEIQLDPENLGKIKVNISFEQGQTNISLTCTNARTAGLLAENASMLAQIIQENNGTSASVNVQDESGYLSQEKGENQNQQSHQQRQNQSSDENQEFSDQIKLGLWEIENLRRQYQMSQIS
ncbi:MAG: flagellar hook-length control protein FliK [Proteocatella sp.]|nr:flagellar hook-length control protein FliK [Proteocatella sp.]